MSPLTTEYVNGATSETHRTPVTDTRYVNDACEEKVDETRRRT
jgi:hypothetical protein